MAADDWKKLQRRITKCHRCPRLIRHCENIAQVKRKQYLEFDYWGKPVPDFGSAPADLLIVGLAPGAHGANRTGRMFTGDRSGDWLFKAMHRAGFANVPGSVDRTDGLELINSVITAVCHCAPPDNKPTSDEVAACSTHLEDTIELCQAKVYLALGKLAWDATWRYAKSHGWHDDPSAVQSADSKTAGRKVRIARPKFAHNADYKFPNGLWMVGSYHPSQQNTFTGRLTEKMFNAVFNKVKRKIASSNRASAKKRR